MKRLLISVLLIFFSFSLFAEDQLKIHFIDVGEGDSVFIEAPSGKNALIDAGNSITGFKVMKYLSDRNIDKINHLIFTHPHLDHIGGSFFIVQNFQVEKIYDNAQDLSQLIAEEDIYRWYHELVRKNSNYRALKANGQLSISEVNLEVLWPNQPVLSSNFNTNSLVIMIKYKDFRGLLMADATVPVEKALLKADRNIKAQVLKVGHHGSDDASHFEFLRAVSPEAAIVSVNKNNIRGYPAKEVLARLRKVKSVVYRTDQGGTVIVTVDEQGNFLVSKENEFN